MFKDRLGISDCVTLLYDLDHLIARVQLPTLDSPFSSEEIKVALTDMPFNHALGPDGFNELFYKKMLEHH